LSFALASLVALDYSADQIEVIAAEPADDTQARRITEEAAACAAHDHSALAATGTLPMAAPRTEVRFCEILTQAVSYTAVAGKELTVSDGSAEGLLRPMGGAKKWSG